MDGKAREAGVKPGGRITLEEAGGGSGTSDSRAYALDVLIDGSPVRRDARVQLTRSTLKLEDREIPLESVFWVSRRAGLVLVFGRDDTVALLGKSSDLEDVARAVERGSDRGAQRLLLQPLAREVVVCTAGTAVSGTVEGTRLGGLHLAVFTQRGLHLIARERRHSVTWPVASVEELDSSGPEVGWGGLALEDEEISLKLRYLFPEEIQAVARVAKSPPKSPADADLAIEMFARGEVAPPLPARLPVFEISVETMREACKEGAERIHVEPELKVGFRPEFFERHFQELGEIALGPLMLRKSAAYAADSLARAVEAMEAEQLREDTQAALKTAADRLFTVYEYELNRLLSEKRPEEELARRFRSMDTERRELGRKLREFTERLEPSLTRVLAREHLLMQRLHALEQGPPGTEEGQVEEAAAQWRSEIVKLDRVYGATWRELIDEIADLWSSALLPRMVRVALLPKRRMKERTVLVLMAIAAFAVVATAVLLLM
jgi:hypothetical protein